MIYFIADTHFFHSNIINLNNRPFKDYEQMHKTLIINWNSYISEYDDIYILGDFAYKGTGIEVTQLLKRLNGKKYLIKGNHDKYVNYDDFDISLFEWIKDYYVLDYKKTKFILFHYPILEWDGYYKGYIHLYGHVHNSNKNIEQKERLKVLENKAFNVGVDVNDFFPISIESIFQKYNS